MSDKAYYHLPGLFEFYEFYRAFLPLYRANRDWFYDWCEIGSIYGAPADCLWGGGRAGFGECGAREALALAQEYGVSARLTFSNSLLREEHLSDCKCNALCELFSQANGVQNGVIVHSELLTDYLKDLGIELIDATCPVVAKLQRRVVEAHEKMRQVGGQVVILGKQGHAEVIGLTGQVEAPTLVVETEEDLDQIDFTRPIYFLSQTTQSIGLFERLGAEMRRRAADAGQVYIDDTICRQVSNREQHLTEFSGRFDAVVFVCGRKSSNGKVLSEVCRRANPRTYVVEEASEIDPRWFDGASSVGICGATSTPKWLMQDVADAIGNLNSEFRIQNS